MPGYDSLMQRDVEQADVEIPSLAATRDTEQRGHECERRRDAGHEVDDGEAHAGWRRAGFAGQVQEAGFGLHQVVVAGPGTPFVVASIRGQMCTDDARIGVLQCFVGEPQFVGLVTAQVVQHGIRLGDQPMEGFLPGRRLQVQCDAALVEVERLEEMAVVLAEEIRAHAARGIAALFAVLDLDDVGTEIGEVHGAERSGAERLEGQHTNAFQGQVRRVHQIGFRSISCRAMIMRCISFVPSPMHISGASR